MKYFASFFLALLLLPRLAFASPLEEGQDAYERKFYETAYKLWRPLAEQGNADAEYNLALLYEKGHGVTQDDAEAGKWFRKAADHGNAMAEAHVGMMYANGWGVTRDIAEASKWYQRSAGKDCVDGLIGVGWLYERGLGVPKDYAEAFRLYVLAMLATEGDNAGLSASQSVAKHLTTEQIAATVKTVQDQLLGAAAKGDLRAEIQLGRMFETGRGVVQDEAEAMKWYRKAADTGDAYAEEHVGDMYLAGHGVPKDAAAAVGWYRKAADQGNALARYQLGSLYSLGTGVTQNYSDAYYWYLLAFAEYNAYQDIRDAVERNMTPEEIASVKKRVAASGAKPNTERLSLKQEK